MRERGGDGGGERERFIPWYEYTTDSSKDLKHAIESFLTGPDSATPPSVVKMIGTKYMQVLHSGL